FFDYLSRLYTYSLSLHDALPIWRFCWIDACDQRNFCPHGRCRPAGAGIESVLESPTGRQRSACARATTQYSTYLRGFGGVDCCLDRKSTRLNSSHEWISYAVFCL